MTFLFEYIKNVVIFELLLKIDIKKNSGIIKFLSVEIKKLKSSKLIFLCLKKFETNSNKFLNTYSIQIIYQIITRRLQYLIFHINRKIWMRIRHIQSQFTSTVENKHNKTLLFPYTENIFTNSYTTYIHDFRIRVRCV